MSVLLKQHLSSRRGGGGEHGVMMGECPPFYWPSSWAAEGHTNQSAVHRCSKEVV